MLRLVFLCVFISGIEMKAVKLGDFLPPCSLNDVKIEECIRSRTQKILPILSKGVREWDLMGLDPIFMPSVFVGHDAGPVTLKWELLNNTFTGFGDVDIDKISFKNLGNGYNFVYNLTVHNFTMIGKYKGRGRLLVVPIHGEGNSYIATQSSKVGFAMNTEKKKRNNEEYLKITDFDVNLKFGKIQVQLTNELKGQKNIGNIINRFINKNIDEVSNELLPTLEEMYGGLLKSYLQIIFNNVPVRELFKQ